MGARIVITEVGPRDSYHGLGVEGLVGEIVYMGQWLRSWKDDDGVTWETVYIRPDRLSGLLLGHSGFDTTEPVCFYQVHYREVV